MIARLIILTTIWCIVNLPVSSDANLFIDAQKAVIAREEALLKQAHHAVKDRIDEAFDSAHKTLLNVVQQMHYYITYPLRAGNGMIEQSRSMLSNATSSLSGYLPFFGSQTIETATVTPNGIRTTDETSLSDRMQMMREQISKLSGVRVVFNTEPEVSSDGPLMQ
ncbi:uncharacterized protein LOC135707810 [Ochlerotatus camptorhynchus]|uniref:uncharacterized protein LOC135707810 n=1 Tax=Ochlerotatus camptorhynchus TaxID=644619 RepID=UPI0031D80FBD